MFDGKWIAEMEAIERRIEDCEFYIRKGREAQAEKEVWLEKQEAMMKEMEAKCV